MISKNPDKCSCCIVRWHVIIKIIYYVIILLEKNNTH
jgi:hypothetical protein